MVNTFITRSPLPDAIRDLDWRRLGKQRVEAQQILVALLSAHAIALILGLEKCPPDDPDFGISREKWYANVWETYKGNTFYRSKTFPMKFSRVKTYECFQAIGKGFVSHPMTKMWIGYEKGLKYYINLCIREWLVRGYNSKMAIHVIFLSDDETLEDILPWWTRSSALHKSHRSALLRKERVRNELKWYWDKEYLYVSDQWYNTGYLWTSHLTLEQRTYLVSPDVDTEDPSVVQMCADIKNDFPPGYQQPEN